MIETTNEEKTMSKIDFKLKKIVYEKKRWQIVLDIDYPIQELQMGYKLAFMPNCEGYAMRIKDLEDEIRAIENNVQDSLLPDEKAGEILERKNQIANVQKEMADFISHNPPIETLAYIRELKRNIATDRVAFEINQSIIPALNAKAYMLDHSYTLSLEDPSTPNIEVTKNNL